MAIVDANKNGKQSAYSEWFKGKLHYLQVEIIEGLNATGIREKFFAEERCPTSIEGLTPEAADYLKYWKVSHPEEFKWMKEEFRFKNGFAGPLPDDPRAVVCNGSRILLIRRNCAPGCGQYDLPVTRCSILIHGKNEGFKVYYPGLKGLLADNVIKKLRCHVNDFYKTHYQLYDAQVRGQIGFFEPFGWYNFNTFPKFSERLSLLTSPLLSHTEDPVLNDIYPNLFTPEWVEFARFPQIEFFGRKTVLYLEEVLGEIPVQHGSHQISV
jgi:hypothetical protein